MESQPQNPELRINPMCTPNGLTKLYYARLVPVLNEHFIKST